MRKHATAYFTTLLFIIFLSAFYFVPIATNQVDKLFLTISTFLFSIFSGFFISRQGTRYSAIREQIAKMDGNLSAIYRASGHLGGDVQKRVGEIIVNYFDPIFVNKSWDYNFTHKSTTMTSLHQLLEEAMKVGQSGGLAGAAVLVKYQLPLRIILNGVPHE